MHDNVGMVSKLLPRRFSRNALLLAAGFFFVLSPSFGQKTDINVNLYGRFATAATGPIPVDNTGAQIPGATPLKQTADPAMGFRFGFRHIFNPIFGLEINFGYSRATQHFTGATPSQNGVVYSHAKPFTIDYVASIPHTFFGVQPFVLGGAGLISYNISSYTATPPGEPSLPARPAKVPVFEYGVGADFHPGLLPNFMALRLQYRGLVGHAPDYRLPYLATNNFTNIAEPQAGLVFKF